MSFLLFLHFFAVLAAVGANNGTPSRLEVALRSKVPGLRPYVQLLGLDTSYMTAFTYGNAEDTDHAIVAEFTAADGEKQTVELPESGLWPSMRRQHYLQLAKRVALLEANPTLSTVLPESIGAHLLAQHDAQRLTLRCRRHFRQQIIAPASTNAADRDPYDPRYFATVYEAQAFLAGGKVQLLRTETASDVAPAAESN